jgi:hypothetical protein
VHDLQHDFAAGILGSAPAPCLSLYQPTHRHHPQNQQDPIRFANLVKTLQRSLREHHGAAEIEELLAPLHALARDDGFWTHTSDGLAVLAAKDLFRVYVLDRPVPERAIVADSFHTKPLLRILQSADRYQVLGLSRQEVRLYEGNRDALGEIELHASVPRTLTDALGEEKTDPRLTVASYGGAGGGQSPMRHGHGGKKAEVDLDAERFFRAVDRAVLEAHSKPSQLPLILATLPEHRALFLGITKNPHVLEAGIDVHPDALSIDELRARAWRVLEPRYLARLHALVEEYQNAFAGGHGHYYLTELAPAAVAGRIATLLVEAERVVPGRMNRATGELDFDRLQHPEVDDVLDDLAEITLAKGGDVVIVPAERMPTASGAAAIYRY